MKKAEIKELGSKELQERLDAAVAALNQLIARMKTELRKRELNKK